MRALVLALLLGCNATFGGGEPGVPCVPDMRSRAGLARDMPPACGVGGAPQSGLDRIFWCGEWVKGEFEPETCVPYGQCARSFEAQLFNDRVICTWTNGRAAQ